MNEKKLPAPFNTPLETGIRSLVILIEAYPAPFDLQRLVEMDYLVVHSGDINGPSSLHAPLPMRAGELLVRRGLVEKGLLLMMSRHLVHQLPSQTGFEYLASDSAAPFMVSLEAPYTRQLKERAEWVVKQFEDLNTEELSQFTHKMFEKWTSEFQFSQQPGQTS